MSCSDRTCHSALSMMPIKPKGPGSQEGQLTSSLARPCLTSRLLSSWLQSEVLALSLSLLNSRIIALQCCVDFCCAPLVAQSCLTLCDPTDCTLSGSYLQGILQARILEWVAIPFSRVSSRLRDWTQVSCIAGRFFTICATVSSVVELSMDIVSGLLDSGY